SARGSGRVHGLAARGRTFRGNGGERVPLRRRAVRPTARAAEEGNHHHAPVDDPPRRRPRAGGGRAHAATLAGPGPRRRRPRSADAGHPQRLRDRSRQVHAGSGLPPRQLHRVSRRRGRRPRTLRGQDRGVVLHRRHPLREGRAAHAGARHRARAPARRRDTQVPRTHRWHALAGGLLRVRRAWGGGCKPAPHNHLPSPACGRGVGGEGRLLRETNTRARSGQRLCKPRPLSHPFGAPSPRRGEGIMSLYIEKAGHGPVPLVLLHGWAMHGGVLAPLVDALADRCTMHVVDLPGHGWSRDCGLPLEPSACAAAIAQATPPALWLGWSLGGLIALTAALEQPQQVRGLAMLCATPRFVRDDSWPWGSDATLVHQLALDLETDYHATIDRFLALEAMGSADPRAELRRLREIAFARGEP